MEELIVRNAGKFQNKELTKATERILSLGTKVKEALFETAAIIAKVDRESLYEIDGFSSVHDWTEKTFGFKKSRSYSLLKIGQEWTEAKTSKTGAITGYHAVLDPAFSTTQIEVMLPAGRSLAEELYRNEEIKPTMTAKEIQQVIKNTMNEMEDVNEEELEEITEDEPENAGTPDILISVTDKEGVIYEVPASVLMQYKV